MKQVKSTAISVFALALALMWLAPLVWLVGTAFSEPFFPTAVLPLGICLMCGMPFPLPGIT